MDHELPGLHWLDDLPELVQASARGESDRVARLLAAGIDPNQADDDGWTALHTAALFNHLPVVMLLLDAGAQADARTTGPEGGFTPLLNAGRASGAVAVVVALLAAGTDPMAQENDLGWRPLQLFVVYGSLKAAQLLIDAGADVNASDFAGDTALMAAACPSSALPARPGRRLTFDW